MLKIGITGGIGSGKTTVCKIFELLGVPVFYADDVAKRIMTEDALLIKEVSNEFGEASYLDGLLNRKHIADIVFKDEAQLEKLNRLVHPAVFRAFDSWVSDKGAEIPYVLKEAALLFESGSDKMCDQTVLVLAPEKLKIERVKQRDRSTEENVLARMKKQFPDDYKLRLARHVIYNDEEHSLIAQVMRLHTQFEHGH